MVNRARDFQWGSFFDQGVQIKEFKVHKEHRSRFRVLSAVKQRWEAQIKQSRVHKEHRSNHKVEYVKVVCHASFFRIEP